MTSLGKNAKCSRFTCDELICTGSITAAHKVFGVDAKNQGEIHHNGSVFYIKWSAVHQVASMDTTTGLSYIHLETTADHGLNSGDTVHISKIPNNPGIISEVNGIPAYEIVGTHLITAVQTSTSFTIGVTTTASNTGTSIDAIPFVKIDRYRFTDMNDSTVSWSNSTTLPTPQHTNIEMFYA